MNKKVVLIVEEDNCRAEKLVFIIQLGGYITRVFSTAAAAMNWAQYGCAEGEALCLLFNTRVEMDRAEQILSLWTATGVTMPLVIVQRGKGSWNNLLAIGAKDHFIVCEPESIMQTLEILTEITANLRSDAEGGEGKRNHSGGVA